ncbi:MAG: carbohydrate ABC transporter permease, partial [Acidimicrobiales bacterium]
DSIDLAMAEPDPRAEEETKPPPRAAKPHFRPVDIAWYLLLTALSVLILFPIYMTFVRAISNPSTVLFKKTAPLTPVDPQWGAFREAFTEGNLGRPLWISALVTILIVVGQTVTSILAAYAFAFLRFPGKRFVFLAFLATLMVPTEVIIVAQFQIVSDLGWLNPFAGLVVPFVAWTFGTFMIRQSFLNVPNDLRDATALDGYGHFGFMWHVAIPLARPAIAGLSVFSFLYAWNQYLWPLLVADDPDVRTVQIGLKSLNSANVDELNLVMAGTLIAALPIALVLIVFQRHLVRGLTAGAVKG